MAAGRRKKQSTARPKAAKAAPARAAVAPLPAGAASASAKAPKDHLPGATFYRLKDAAPPGKVTDADQYLVDLARSPLIQEITEGDCVMRLYGYRHGGDLPSFAPFLARFEQLSLPRIPRFAYVLIMRVLSEPTCWYAMGFGHGGRHLLKDELIDVDAHRDVVRRETLPEGPGEVARIKQVRTRMIGAYTTLIQRRASRASTMGEINVDTFAEIVDEIDGAPKNREKFGTALSGGQGLTVRRHVSLDEVAGIASDFEASYREAAAETGAAKGTMFPVKDKALLSRLDDELARMVRDPHAEDDCGIAIPDFIRAEDEPEVRFTKIGHGAPPFSDDVTLHDYREAMRAAGVLDEVDVAYLRAADLIVGGDDGGKARRFSVYRCLTALVEMGGEKYVHYDRSWYGIPGDVLQFIDDELAGITLWDGMLPTPAARTAEPKYNEDAGRGEYLLMDTKLATPVGGQTPVEVCDLFTLLLIAGRDVAAFIHVKRDFASSSLSHLFEQGRVSAFLLQERAQRAVVLERIQAELRGRTRKPSWSRRVAGLLGDAGFQARNACVIYAITGDWNGKSLAQRLPFFSKVALVGAAHLLRGRDFDVRVARVQMAGPTYPARRKKASPAAAARKATTAKKTGRKKAGGSAPARKRAGAAAGATRKKANGAVPTRAAARRKKPAAPKVSSRKKK